MRGVVVPRYGPPKFWRRSRFPIPSLDGRRCRRDLYHRLSLYGPPCHAGTGRRTTFCSLWAKAAGRLQKLDVRDCTRTLRGLLPCRKFGRLAQAE